ncbi:hypothetical protein JL721_9834 [Aureococcus anophagefferens]|nr:hypothetical protein JL721_9834 [Aureococcus anophagefferens]
MVAALSGAPAPAATPTLPMPEPAAEAAAPAETPAPAPAPASGAVRRLTKQMIARVLQAASHYEILGVDAKTSSSKDIKVAYRDLACLVHPDKCSEEGAAEAFKKVNEAHETLSDDTRRARRRQPKKRRGGGLKSYKVAQLKQACEKLGLKVSGTKDVLISRLEDAQRGIYDRPGSRGGGSAAKRPRVSQPRAQPRAQSNCICHRLRSYERNECPASIHACLCRSLKSYERDECKAHTHVCLCRELKSYERDECKAHTHVCLCRELKSYERDECKADTHHCLCPGLKSYERDECRARAHACICHELASYERDECRKCN